MNQHALVVLFMCSSLESNFQHDDVLASPSRSYGGLHRQILRLRERRPDHRLCQMKHHFISSENVQRSSVALDHSLEIILSCSF